MPIKFATLEDVPGLVEMARRMHALTRFRMFEFNEQRITRTFQEVIEKGKDRYAFFAAIGSEGQVVGGLIGVLERHIFSDQLTASVMHIDVVPEARMGGYGPRLLRGFEKWARNRDAVEITFGVNSGVDTEAVDRFARRMNYSHVGGNYFLRLSHMIPLDQSSAHQRCLAES